MRTSDKINEIATALSKAQGEMKHAEKGGNNPRFSSDYARLEDVINACRETLSKNGICYTQAGRKDLDDWMVVTRLIHTSGQWIESDHPVVTLKPGPQEFGSGMTYARRYSLLAIIGLGAEDDDGEDAQRDFHGQSLPPAETKAAPKSEIRKELFNPGPGDYILPFGKHKGKKLMDISASDLTSYMKYMETNAAKENKPITGEALRFMQAAEKFINSQL